MSPIPPPAYTYPKKFTDDDDWLEPVEVVEDEPTPCCTRCRRGTKAHGHQPCGYPRGCPNRSCKHAASDA